MRGRLDFAVVVCVTALGCSAGAPGPAAPTVTLAPASSGASVVAASPEPIAPMPPPRATDPASGHVCTEVVGLDMGALTFDGGKTLVRSRTAPRRGAAMSAVVSLGLPYTLAALAVVDIYRGKELFLSTDGGCTWITRGRLAAVEMRPADGLAYAWGGTTIFGITPDHVVQLDSPSPVSYVQADPRDARHLRVFADRGIYDVRWSAGRTGDPSGPPTWTLAAPPKSLGRHVVALDPGDWDHLLVAPHAQSSAEASRDGGRTWRPSPGTSPRTSALVMSADGRRAWAFGEQVARSDDGGETFRKVGDAPAGTLMLAGTDGTTAELVGNDVDTPFVVRLDMSTGQLLNQPLPARARPPERAAQLARGALVPNEPSALCLGITETDLSFLDRM